MSSKEGHTPSSQNQEFFNEEIWISYSQGPHLKLAQIVPFHTQVHCSLPHTGNRSIVPIHIQDHVQAQTVPSHVQVAARSSSSTADSTSTAAGTKTAAPAQQPGPKQQHQHSSQNHNSRSKELQGQDASNVFAHLHYPLLCLQPAPPAEP